MNPNITRRKEDFIDELIKWNYKVTALKNDLTQLRITGKNDSFIYNLRTTNNKRRVDELDEIWFDVSKNLLDKCDYIILLPVDSYGFYNIPVQKFKDNIDIMFAKKSMQPSFTLLFSEERIIGLRNAGYVDLAGDYCLLFPDEMKWFDIISPELPGFPTN